MPLEVADMRESKLDQVGFTFLAAAWRGSCQAKLCSYNQSQGILSAQRGPTDSKKKYQKCLGPSRGCPGSQVIQVYLFIQISVRQSQLSGLPGSQLSNSGKPFRIGTNQEMPGDGYLPNRSPWMPWIPLRIAAKVQVYLFSRDWKGIFCLL